eukprot:TRINITY_DN2083_c0_g3_i1.p1 TRINITY_DN2083_c0_g3~~TRINITY_DN2083_c0_g3_i1.p1  ORF type:complete len:538 (+),score=53.46 TRINITY_DN2083_c0_g3_i1:116-1729(+)
MHRLRARRALTKTGNVQRKWIREMVEEMSPEDLTKLEITRDLNTAQKIAYDRVASGENLLLMGAAGTGKSHATRAMRAGRLVSGKNVAACAPYGVAACNVDGFTVHSTFGINVNDFEAYSMFPNDSSNAAQAIRQKLLSHSLKHRKKLWEVLDTLFIDEISTCDRATITLLDFMAKQVRGNDKPFGGIQIVGVGDFLQLPPVNGRWAFESPVFPELFEDQNIVQLNDVIRQNGDREFTETLNFIRTLHPNDATAMMYAKELIKKTCNTSQTEPPSDAVRVVPLTRMAVNYNAKQLDLLKSPIITYTAFDSAKPRIDSELASMYKKVTGAALKRSTPDARVVQTLDSMLARGRFDAEIVIKKGARIMHLFNNTKGIISNKGSSEKIVNGHSGVVIGFEKPNEKSRTAEYELWSAKRLEAGLGVEVPIIKWDHNKRTSPVLPVKLVVGDMWNTNCYIKERVQFPICLSWAMTAHKCQGMTIEGKVSVSLRGSFAPGQSYVSLSRSKSGDLTYVDGIEKAGKGFAASPVALQYLGIQTFF